MWAVEWKAPAIGLQRIVAAGAVWTRTPGDGATAAFPLGGSGVFSVFNRRVMFGEDLAAPFNQWKLALNNLDLGSIMRQVASTAMSLPNGSLPVVLEAPRTGTHSRNYNSWDVAYAGQRITELSEVEPNTDFLFQPRFKANDTTSVEWDMFTGTQSAPQLTSAQPRVLDGRTKGQGVIGRIHPDYDGSSLTTTAWAKGGGSEAATVVKSASDPSLTASGWPRLDLVESNNAEESANVQAWANGSLARNRRPKRGVRVEVDAAWWYAQPTRLGDRVQLLANHAVLGPVDLSSRVLAESGSLGSRFVTLTLADSIAEDWD